MMEPPQFEEALRCNVCKCSFNAFRRRHHCRCCGKTLCNEHSSKQIPLPQFGIHSAVRVCNNCFNNSTQSSNVNTETVSNDIHVVASSDIDAGSFSDIDTAATNFSNLDLSEDNFKDSKSQNLSQVVECKCGMPLCICQAPPPPQVQPVVPPTSNYQRPKKVSNVQQGSFNPSSISSASSSGSNKPSVFFNSGQTTNGNVETNSKDYGTSGEGLREAIKNGDVSAVKELLMQGVDANYCDKQGMSLLHLATVFNHTEITFILMNAGASVDAKNAQGETPLDCAPTMLQYKMHQKMQEAGHPS